MAKTVKGIRVAVLGDKEWRDVLSTVRPKAGAAMERAVLRGLLLIEGSTKERLDNRVLNRRTSTLFRSIHHVFKRRGLNSFGSVGTPVIYGKTHELGLELTIRGRTVKFPVRAFLQPSFEEHEEEIVRGIRGAIREVLP